MSNSGKSSSTCYESFLHDYIVNLCDQFPKIPPDPHAFWCLNPTRRALSLLGISNSIFALSATPSNTTAGHHLLYLQSSLWTKYRSTSHVPLQQHEQDMTPRRFMSYIIRSQLLHPLTIEGLRFRLFPKSHTTGTHDPT